MKKQLLFGFAAFAAMAITAQNNSRFAINPKAKKMVTHKPYSTSEVTSSQYLSVSTANVNKTASAAKRIGGSVNSIGVQNTAGRALTYNASINTIGMIIRKQAGWTGVTGGNSGTMAYAYSSNAGASWDSTILVASSTKLMRHPGGTIFNPAGNTNPANAYIVGSGPWHPGSSWQGNFFASKQLTFPGSNSTGSAIFPDNLNLALTPGQIKQDFARTDMQNTTDGKIHVLGELIANINDVSSNAAYGWRGVALNYGTFNAGSFTWTVDSLKPNFKLDGAGDANGSTQSNQAWSEDGTIGYVVFTGVDANAVAGTSMNTFQPYVYKTTNSGATWFRYAPLYDFNTIPSISDRLYIANGPVAKAFVSVGEGSSATVDASGNLHFLATFTSAYSDNIDSLGYTISPNYNYFWNYITDFSTTSNGGWCAFVVDSLSTEGPTAAETNWLGGASGALAYDARLQISRSTDGMKLVYSWVDSDTLITSSHFNTQPNIRMKGYDLATNKMTATKDMSTGKAGADYNSFWFLSSPIIANPVAGTWQVPTIYTASDDGTLIPDNPVSYYYMDDNTFSSADFNTLYIGGCTPTGIKQQANTTFENMNFYPNPASSNGTIDVQLNETAKLDITILNSVGQSVFATSVSGNIGSNKVNVNLSSLSSGLYFYQVKIDNSKAVTKKFAVEK
jgi:hypothetical protein